MELRYEQTPEPNWEETAADRRGAGVYNIADYQRGEDKDGIYAEGEKVLNRKRTQAELMAELNRAQRKRTEKRIGAFLLRHNVENLAA